VNIDHARTREIAQIHVAKKQLAIDDGDYRRILMRLTGKESSARMTMTERHAVIRELKRLGFVARPGVGAKVEKLHDGEDLVARKIRACWLDLRDAGILRDSSERALRAFVKRMTGKEVLKWLTPEEANRVIEALKGMLARGKKEEVES